MFKAIKHVNDGGREPRMILDEAVGANVPVVIMEMTSHSAWANTAALKKLGWFGSGVVDPPAGQLMRNPDNSPNGLIFENAVEIAFGQALDLDRYQRLEQIQLEGLDWSMKQMAKNGITSLCDARVYWNGRDIHKIWQKHAASNGGYGLTARVNLGLWAYPELDDAYQIEEMAKLFDNDGSDFLRINQVKLYSDGIIDANTAAMLEPYENNDPVLPDMERGMHYFDKTRMTNLIGALQGAGNGQGFDFHIHTIGDQGVRHTMDAIENNIGNKDLAYRHRLTHVELVDRADVPRFANLKIPADAQVTKQKLSQRLKNQLSFLGCG